MTDAKRKLLKTKERLSPVEVAHLVGLKEAVSKRYADGGGLWLSVDKRNYTASWVLVYSLDGKARSLGLGSYPIVGLAKARKRAHDAKVLVSDGVDPVAQKRAAKVAKRLAEAKAVTFKDAAERYFSSQSAGWRSAQHARQWSGSLALWVYPLIGDVAVSDIDNAMVLRVLQQDVKVADGVERFWTAHTETAYRVRGRIENVLGWAIAGGHRTAENCARWDILKHQLPARSKLTKVKHFTALPHGKMADFMSELRLQQGTAASALEFLILTAARTGEVQGATWSEVELTTQVWTVPGARMKGGREHRVPLSPAAVAVLEALPRGGDDDLIFAGAKPVLSLLKAMGHTDITVHGFRNAFRDWMSDETSFANELGELALAHAIKNGSEAAYRRGDQIDKRQLLMDAWAAYCAGEPMADNVTLLRHKGAA